MRASQLAKQHGHKLAPTGEAPRVPLGLVLLDRLFEIPARKKLQHLRKNAAYFVHRLSLLRLYWFFRNPIQRIRGSAFHSHSRFPGPPRGITQLFWTAMFPTTPDRAAALKSTVQAAGVPGYGETRWTDIRPRLFGAA